MPVGAEPDTDKVVPFAAGDGFACNLIHVRAAQPATRGPVLLVHGAGVRANLFRPPLECTLVEFLAQQGWDIWLENWRASIDLPFNSWTLDQAAVYDHPAAVRAVQEHTGASSVKAVVHCQGSTSFTMAAVAGLLPQVTTIVSNAVSLFTVTPRWSSMKLRAATPLLERVTPYLNPQWGPDTPALIARALVEAVELSHHECHNDVCRLVSFIYGSGHPALWSHENLSAATHEWIRREFAKVPLSFFDQIERCIEHGHLIAVNGMRELPLDFVSQPPQTDARFAFLAGEQNRCFLPQSQVQAFEWFDRQRPGYHSLHLLPDYGHLDVFFGNDAATDVFPIIARELEQN